MVYKRIFFCALFVKLQLLYHLIKHVNLGFVQFKSYFKFDCDMKTPMRLRIILNFRGQMHLNIIYIYSEG